MSSFGAGPSEQADLQLHYHEMFIKSQRQEESGGSDDEEMESADETTDDGAARGGSETSSQAKRRWERKPNKVGTVKEKFTLVDPGGVPKEPKKVAKGFGNQCAAIL